MEENPDRRDEYMDLFVDLQLKVHAQDLPAAGQAQGQDEPQDRRRPVWTPPPATSCTRDWQGMPNHKKLCHGDFNPTNIILRDDGEAFILDWSHATQGNASADAARTYLLFWLAGDIDGAESYLHLFCKKSDTARQYVQKWIPIVAASQSVKGRAEEREFLLHWVNVVDYE